MSNLGQYMKEVLENGHSVYLPEIGTFRKERVPAFFDALKDCFVPPFRNLTLTDEHLPEVSILKLIASKADSQKRRQLIEREITDLKEELRNGEEVILEGLGRLKQNGDRIEFNAAGLAWNDFPDYAEVSELQILSVPVMQEPIVEEPLEELAVPLDAPLETSSSRSWVWLIAILLLSGAVFAWFWYSPKSPQGEQITNSGDQAQQQKPAGTERVAVSSPADTQTTPVPAIAATDSAEIAPTAQELLPVREPGGRFEIIIAAFHTMEEATDYVKRTKAKGHDVYIIKNKRPNNLNKVSFASFDTEREVNEAIARVRKEINPDAWIYKTK